MLEGLLINPKTSSSLERYMAKPSHALLLTGQSGAGKASLARAVSAKMLNMPAADLIKHSYYYEISRPEGKQEIPIESVRNIIKSLQLKVPGNAPVKQIAVILDSQFLSEEAQNALLKSLEEPPAGTLFILTATSPHDLLPTIVSRATAISVEPISLDDAKKFFTSKEDLLPSWNLSQGAAGLLASLLDEGQESELRQAVDQAKQIMAAKPYDRLVSLDRIKDKSELASVIEAMGRVVKALYRASASQQNPKRTQALLQAQKIILRAQENIELNVSPRLVILSMVLSLPI